MNKIMEVIKRSAGAKHRKSVLTSKNELTAAQARKRGGETGQGFGFAMLLPSFLGIAVFYLVPFCRSLYYTFTQGVHDVHFVGLANFRELLGNPVFLQAAGNTLRFLALGVPLLLALALLVSVIGVKRKFTWQRWALLLPMVIPASSLSVAWQGLWGETGLISRALGLLGLPAVDFLQGGAAFPLLLVLYLLKNVGYVSVILMSAIRSLPPEYQECYRLDSNSEAGFVRRILLPLISPTILFACIVAVMNYFLLFRDTYMLYMENPPAKVYMLQHFMNSNFYKLNYQRLGTAAFLVVLTLTALISGILLAQRRMKRHVG